MAHVRSGRRVERAGINALRSLLEAHGHLVQEIDGGIDHGEDLFLMVVNNGRRTGHVLAIQVKSGRTYKRANGYAIPIGNHRTDWEQSRIPVIGVVFDKDMRQLYWVNLTEELRNGNRSSWIRVSGEYELNDRTIKGFIRKLQRYIDARGMRIADTTGDLSTSINAARSGQGGVMDGSKDVRNPNPTVEWLADLLLRHPRAGITGGKLMIAAVAASCMAIEWPLQNKFFAAYIGEPSWPYVVSMHAMIAFLVVTYGFELKAGRFTEGIYRFLGFIVCFYSLLPFQMADDPSTDQWWGRMWAWPMVLLPGPVVTYWISRLALEELDRKRAHDAGY